MRRAARTKSTNPHSKYAHIRYGASTNCTALHGPCQPIGSADTESSRSPAMEDAMPTHRRTFPGEPQQLRAARNWTRTTLNGHPHTEDAALIVTELSTNVLM